MKVSHLVIEDLSGNNSRFTVDFTEKTWLLSWRDSFFNSLTDWKEQLTCVFL